MRLQFDLEWSRGDFKLQAAATIEAQLIGLFGPSGAGKSRLLALLAGLERPDRGRVLLDGETLVDTERDVFIPAHQRRVGVVFQEGRLFPHLDVRRNLRYGEVALRGRDRRAVCVDFDTVVDLLELAPFLDRPPRDLSGGERQRVALGRALLAGPRLLLLDEPLSALDALRRNRILPFLRRAIEEAGVPAIHVSHDLTEVLRLTSRILLLDDGTIRGSGEYLELAQQGIIPSQPGSGLVNVFTLRVTGRDDTDGALLLAPAHGDSPQWIGPSIPMELGTHVQVSIRTEDVALAVPSVEPSDVMRGLSIQNRLRGRVLRTSVSHGVGFVEVDVGQRILVEVGPSTLDRLHLSTGTDVVVLVKARALEILGPATRPTPREDPH